jgi:hypothetical protein
MLSGGVPVSRRTQVLAFLIVLLPTGRVVAANLKIADSRGTEVVLTGASVDYSGFLASNKETQGIRVLQGDGLVVLKWTDVESLTVMRRDDSVKPPRLELEIVLRNGKRVPAALFRSGQVKLSGKTDLGDYSIDLEKVRTIMPVR